MRIIWTLHYDRQATAFLYSLRGTSTGTAIRDAIKALQFEDDPTKGCDPIPERPGRYMFTVSGHRVGIEVKKEGGRKAIVILYVRAN